MGLAKTTVEREEIFRITLCGSTRFRDEFELWNKRLTLAGFLVYSVCGFGHSGDTFTDEEKTRLDEIHLAKIDASHAIVVVGDGYVGASTSREIDHALRSGKPVYSTAYVLDLPLGAKLKIRYIYGLRIGPEGPTSLRYRAFDWTPADGPLGGQDGKNPKAQHEPKSLSNPLDQVSPSLKEKDRG